MSNQRATTHSSHALKACLRYSSAIMMHSGTRGRPALLATATRCACSPKRSRWGMATPARPLPQKAWATPVPRSAARAARPAPPAVGANRSFGPGGCGKSHRSWRCPHTPRKQPSLNISLGNLTIGHHFRSPACVWVAGGLLERLTVRFIFKLGLSTKIQEKNEIGTTTSIVKTK